jgi:hypothetical protein
MKTNELHLLTKNEWRATKLLLKNTSTLFFTLIVTSTHIPEAANKLDLTMGGLATLCPLIHLLQGQKHNLISEGEIPE